MKLPKITIVTPSLNQGKFLEQTILSVLNQNYPNLEYIIMDGGSTDNSLDIIKRYSGMLTYWQTSQDNGQADAIANGFEIASGSILGWLNSDDVLLPGCLEKVASEFPTKSEGVALSGRLVLINSDSKPIKVSVPLNRHWQTMLVCGHGLGQMGTFWSREAYQQIGGLDRSLHFSFDYDLFVKLRKVGKIKIINDYLSGFRIHPAQKTFTMRAVAISEHRMIIEQYDFQIFTGLSQFLQRLNLTHRVISAFAWLYDRQRIETLCKGIRNI